MKLRGQIVKKKKQKIKKHVKANKTNGLQNKNT